MPRPAWIALGVVSGALALGVVGPGATAVAGAIVAGIAVLARLARVARFVRPLLPIAIGVIAIGVRGGIESGPVMATATPQGDGPWVGVISSVGATREGSRPAVVLLDGSPPTLVAASLPWYPPVVPSDRVELRGRIRPPPDNEYGDYLASIGAVGTLRVESLEVLPASGSIGRVLSEWRQVAASALQRAMPEPEAGLASGVLIGLRELVDRDLAAAFTTAGASHVVAISGWNIAIVASTLGAVAGSLRRRRRALLTAAAIVVYVAFVGPSPSVVRAGAMAGVALLAREVGRPGSAIAALGWACTVLLLIDPTWIDDAGFRLSALATAGILAWGTGLTNLLAGPEPGRVRRFVADVLGVSFAAQAATTPIVLLDFGRLSLVAPLVNLIVVPLVPPAMAASAIALLAGIAAGIGAPAILATIIGLPAWLLYAAMVTTVRVGAALPLASLELKAPWDTISAATSALAILGVARYGRRAATWLDGRRGRSGPRPRTARPAAARRRSSRPPASRAPRLAAIALAGASIALALSIAYRPGGVVHVTVLDVGQGDGILVEGGRGGRMVVDGGPDPGRLLVALDERLPPWDRRIDILILTHPHEDHVAGLAPLLQRYRVGRVFEPGMIGPGPGYDAWTAAFASGGPPHGRLAAGDRLTLDSIHFRVLWPDANRVPARPPDGGTSINNVSIVLLGEVGGQRFLLAGDVEEGVDPELLGRGLPALDLLKVAHHGSKTATTREFLERVTPRVAVVSAGAGNPYGHPAPATIERLQELAGRTYRTDTDGSVDVALDGQTVRVKTSGARPGAPRATPRSTASVALPAVGQPVRLAAFLCSVPPGSGAPRAAVVEPPVAPEAPGLPVARLGPPPVPPVVAALPRPGGLVDDPASGPGYHPDDGLRPIIGDRAGPRNGSPRLLLGRRRVLARRRGGRVPKRYEALSRGCAGALAPGRRPGRSRPPPGRDP